MARALVPLTSLTLHHSCSCRRSGVHLPDAASAQHAALESPALVNASLVALVSSSQPFGLSDATARGHNRAASGGTG